MSNHKQVNSHKAATITAISKHEWQWYGYCPPIRLAYVVLYIRMSRTITSKQMRGMCTQMCVCIYMVPCPMFQSPLLSDPIYQKLTHCINILNEWHIHYVTFACAFTFTFIYIYSTLQYTLTMCMYIVIYIYICIYKAHSADHVVHSHVILQNKNMNI